MRSVKFCLTGVALALAACSPGTGRQAASASGGESAGLASAPSLHPISGLQVIPLTVQHEGKTFSFRVEVAQTSVEQAKGLMFRQSMGPDEGMLFPMKPARQSSFWMRNTVISLDIVFIGPDGRIANIAANAVPYDETPLPSKGLAAAVLELNGGRAAELGIVPGDRVKW